MNADGFEMNTDGSNGKSVFILTASVFICVPNDAISCSSLFNRAKLRDLVPTIQKTSTARAIWAVWQKDFRSEWRVRAALNAVALFSVAAPVALGYSVATQKLEPEVLGGLLWTTLFFAALLGLPRAFVKEEESGTASLLRLHFSSDAVLWGKVLGQLALLGVTQLAAVPLFVLLLGAKVEAPLLLLFTVILGDVGLAVSSSILGAMAAQARSKGALFSALAVPLMLPLLSSLSIASGAAFGARVEAGPSLQVVAAFDLVLVAGAWMTFEFVWD